jgi:hypothetical protein
MKSVKHQDQTGRDSRSPMTTTKALERDTMTALTIAFATAFGVAVFARDRAGTCRFWFFAMLIAGIAAAVLELMQ